MGKNMKSLIEPDKNSYKEFKVENPKLINGFSKLSKHKLDNNEYVSKSIILNDAKNFQHVKNQ